MNKYFLSCLIALLLQFYAVVPSKAQRPSFPLTFSLFTNASSLPPGVLTNLFNSPLHPGFTLGTEFKYNQSEKHELLQTVKLGYFYHRYSQHAVQLYTEGAYRLYPIKNFSLGPLLGLGYLHSFPDTQLFELNNAGEYKRKTNFGKPQAMATLSLETGYSINREEAAPIRIFLNYQCWIQFPFVKQYVPILPSTALHIGISMPLE